MSPLLSWIIVILILLCTATTVQLHSNYMARKRIKQLKKYQKTDLEFLLNSQAFLDS